MNAERSHSLQIRTVAGGGITLSENTEHSGMWEQPVTVFHQTRSVCQHAAATSTLPAPAPAARPVGARASAGPLKAATPHVAAAERGNLLRPGTGNRLFRVRESVGFAGQSFIMYARFGIHHHRIFKNKLTQRKGYLATTPEPYVRAPSCCIYIMRLPVIEPRDLHWPHPHVRQTCVLPPTLHLYRGCLSLSRATCASRILSPCPPHAHDWEASGGGDAAAEGSNSTPPPP